MNFNNLYWFIAECFLAQFFKRRRFFFHLDLYLFLSLLYGTQVYSFAAIPAICRLCLLKCCILTLIFCFLLPDFFQKWFSQFTLIVFGLLCCIVNEFCVSTCPADFLFRRLTLIFVLQLFKQRSWKGQIF